MSITTEMLRFIDHSPTPFHAAANAAARLADAGFTVVDDLADVAGAGDSGVLLVDGALMAWLGRWTPEAGGFRIIGAHTDSPNLRLRPNPDTGGYGCRQVAVETYGGLLLNSWLDRDLGVAGRVVIDDDGTPTARLVESDRPIMRVPQLAVHLDREVNEKGLVLNRQLHLTPISGLGDPYAGAVQEWAALMADVDAAEVLAWDLMAYDMAPAAVIGVEEDLISAPRLDDQACCFGAVEALIQVASAPDLPGRPVVVALVDHEEVGSESATGAAGPLLERTLETLVATGGGSRAEYLATLPRSRCLSADMAHAVHPNYPDRHEPNHRVLMGGGPVVKSNANRRYATDAMGQSEFEAACRGAGIASQRFTSRGDIACGSTIGPITSTRLSIPTVDVGMAMLAMHSIREMMAVSDVAAMVDSFVSVAAVEP